MSNFLLRDPDCVFIHLPKTGGTSIRKGCWEGRWEGPTYGHVPQAWRGHFSFAFVRHPFERLISAWRMFAEGTRGPTAQVAPGSGRGTPLAEFCTAVRDESVIYDERHRSVSERIRHHALNRPGFTGGQNSRRIAHYGTDTKEEDLEAVFT